MKCPSSHSVHRAAHCMSEVETLHSIHSAARRAAVRPSVFFSFFFLTCKDYEHMNNSPKNHNPGQSSHKCARVTFEQKQHNPCLRLLPHVRSSADRGTVARRPSFRVTSDKEESYFFLRILREREIMRWGHRIGGKRRGRQKCGSTINAEEMEKEERSYRA